MKNKDDDEPGVLRSLYVIRCNQNKYNKRKMKTAILSAALMLASTVAMAQKSNFQLKVDLKNFNSDSVLVYKGRNVKMDTVLVKNGKFTYSANLDKAAGYVFLSPEAYRGAGQFMFNLPCVPGEKAEVKGDAKTRFDISGSKFYQQYHEVDVLLENANKELRDYEASLNQRIKNGETQQTIMAEYEQKAPALQKAKDDKIFDFVKQHPDYEACATIFEQFDDVSKMEKLLGLLSENVKNGRMKAFYQPMIDMAKKRAEAEEKAKKVQAAGVEAPDFTLKDIKGNDFKLSSLRGKIVVLDFWGSWCGWCIKGMPKMKEYYEKYKGKFEILGVDCNDTEAKWKAAVEKHQLPWIHVYNSKDSKVLSDYAVQGFPTKIVIDANGKIIKTIVGEDPAFYTLLDAILFSLAFFVCLFFGVELLGSLEIVAVEASADRYAAVGQNLSYRHALHPLFLRPAEVCAHGVCLVSAALAVYEADPFVVRAEVVDMVVSAVYRLSAAELAYGVKHSAVERRTADGFIHPAVENLRFSCRNILPVFVELHNMLELRQGNVKIHHRFYFSVFLFRPAHAVFVPFYLLRLQEVVALHALGHSVVFVISLAYVAP